MEPRGEGRRRITAQPSTTAPRISRTASPRTVYYHVLIFSAAAHFMKVKIQPNYRGICSSCRNGSLAESANGEFLVRCDWFGWKIPGPMVTCSRYDDRRMPSLLDMRRTAWILRTDDKQKAIGFVSNHQWRKSREFQPGDLCSDDDD